MVKQTEQVPGVSSAAAKAKREVQRAKANINLQTWVFDKYLFKQKPLSSQGAALRQTPGWDLSLYIYKCV